MAIEIYLAMTGVQIRKDAPLPGHVAWMACHFSLGSPGLSNCPQWLPPGSLLILDDSLPMDGHNPQLILRQLQMLLGKLHCRGLLLDLQRPGCADTEVLVRVLREGLECPVAVSALYDVEGSGPVLVPPVPAHQSPARYLAPWMGREIWLELAAEGSQIILTKTGAVLRDWIPEGAGKHRHERIHCSYDITLEPGRAVFTARRDQRDLEQMLRECEALGVTSAIGLYQEFPGLE